MDSLAIKATWDMGCTTFREGGVTKEKCCTWETDSKTEVWTEYCTTCTVGTDDPCDHKQTNFSVAPPSPSPSPTPMVPENALPQGEVQQLTPTPPPTGDKGIFGSNILPTQPTGIAPPTTTATPSPSPQTTPPPTTGLKGPQGQLMAPEGGVLPPQSPAGGGEQGQSRIFDSPTGGCIPFIKNNCIPCDPGLPVGDCMPASDWPPGSTTGEDILQSTPSPTVPPFRTPLGIAPGAETLQGDEGTQPQTQDDGITEGEEGPPVEQPEDDEQEQPSNEGVGPAGPLT